ncbi:MAG TPA: hypothetical protein ENG73_04900 [Desulfobacterales bacterium]|nr:hypothetical protein [Desulfobacterales bacterium]
MGSIIIGKNEDILKIKNKIQADLKSIKMLKAKQYVGKIRLKQDALAYQKQARREWSVNEYTD